MSKHTPGPWEAEGPEQFYGEAVCDLNNGWRVVTLKADPNEYEPEADARLIAAAPRMKKALERIHEMRFQDLDAEDLLESIGIEAVNALQEAEREQE